MSERIEFSEDVATLTDGELETLRTSSGDDVDMALVECAVRELRERRAADTSSDGPVALLLLKRVRTFVDKHRLSEPAVLAQSDRAQEALIDFVNSCARIVGWHQRRDD